MSKKTSSGGSSRVVSQRVKTSKGRKISSTLWLQRQLNDPYVQQARRDGYRSRAAYKLLELDEKFNLLKAGMNIVDLGCAPGGWTQVAAAKLAGNGMIVGIDLLPMDEIPGAITYVQDFTAEDAPATLIAHLKGKKAHLVMSDMASNTTGHAPTDHLRIVHLCELAFHFAVEILQLGGAFVCKVRQGGTEGVLLKEMRQRFETVKHAKPKASRSDSAESYVVALGFRG